MISGGKLPCRRCVECSRPVVPYLNPWLLPFYTQLRPLRALVAGRQSHFLRLADLADFCQKSALHLYRWLAQQSSKMFPSCTPRWKAERARRAQIVACNGSAAIGSDSQPQFRQIWIDNVRAGGWKCGGLSNGMRNSCGRSRLDMAGAPEIVYEHLTSAKH